MLRVIIVNCAVGTMISPNSPSAPNSLIDLECIHRPQLHLLPCKGPPRSRHQTDIYTRKLNDYRLDMCGGRPLQGQPHAMHLLLLLSPRSPVIGVIHGQRTGHANRIIRKTHTRERLETMATGHSQITVDNYI